MFSALLSSRQRNNMSKETSISSTFADKFSRWARIRYDRMADQREVSVKIGDEPL